MSKEATVGRGQLAASRQTFVFSAPTETLERAVVGREDARNKLAVARSALEYVLEHHVHSDECVCPAARSVAQSALDLTEAER